MQIPQILILISLILGLIGALTETHKKINDKRKLTRWGYVLLALIITSGILSFFSSVRSASESKASAAKAAKEYERRNNELNTMLSQQRFISLVATGSAFDLGGKPTLFLSLLNEQDTATGDVLDSPYNLSATSFPGFGTVIDSVTITLNINEDRKAYFAKRFPPFDEPLEIPSLSVESASLDSLSFFAEQTPSEMLYGFHIANYNQVMEVLFDFKPGTTIGTISFSKAGGAVTSADAEKIDEILKHPNTSVYVYVYIKRQGVKVYQTYVYIPLFLKTTSGDTTLEYELTTGEPHLGAEQFFGY